MEIMLQKLIKVQMSVPNGDSTQQPSQGFAISNSIKLFGASYQVGRTDPDVGHVKTIRTH